MLTQRLIQLLAPLVKWLSRKLLILLFSQMGQEMKLEALPTAPILRTTRLLATILAVMMLRALTQLLRRILRKLVSRLPNQTRSPTLSRTLLSPLQKSESELSLIEPRAPRLRLPP